MKDKTLELSNLYVTHAPDCEFFAMSQPVTKRDHPEIEFITIDRAHAVALRDYLIERLA